MKSGKDTFQDRLGQAAEAKQRALEKLKTRPAADPQAVADRQAAQARRDAAKAEKAAARRAAIEAERAQKAALAAEKASAPPPPTEEDKKRARDARYAARKSRAKR
jgi:DNA-binding helix-hairpin-helix protein with protein kinase domain